MTRYGLPVIAALILTFAVISIATSRPVHVTVAPLSAPPTAAFASNVGAVGIVEANSENISVSPAVAGLVTEVYVKPGDSVS